MRKERFRKKKRGKPWFRRKLHLVTILVIFILLFSYAVLYHISHNVNPNGTRQLKAAIVDHLSAKPATDNQTFVEATTALLETAGFTVDYYEGEEVTVDFYWNLATHGYYLILLRVHSAFEPEGGSLDLFTSEPFSKYKYLDLQMDRQIGEAAFVPYNEGDLTYFAITPEFVRRSMIGRFDDTVVFMMGCSGMENTMMAEAFVEKGAKVYLGWDELVFPDYIDHATTVFVRHLVVDRQTIGEAVAETMMEVGSGAYDSELLYYPVEARDFVISSALSP